MKHHGVSPGPQGYQMEMLSMKIRKLCLCMVIHYDLKEEIATAVSYHDNDGMSLANALAYLVSLVNYLARSGNMTRKLCSHYINGDLQQRKSTV